jgi:DNA-binding response OmpR family regulator
MSKCKIAIVEDDEITALNLKMSLTKQNYDVVTVVDNAEQALHEIALNRPEVIIIDISLQDSSDGITLAQDIKLKYHIPFIFLTSHCSNEIIEAAKKTKPYGYIVKPFHPNTLHASIQMGLLQFREEQEEQVDPIQKTEDKILHFGINYAYHPLKQKFCYDNKIIDLKDVEVAFMQILTAKLGVVIPYEEATQEILEKTKQTVSIRTLVWRLRNKLDTDIIKNAEGIGYYIEE